jgi:hypothetical protein
MRNTSRLFTILAIAGVIILLLLLVPRILQTPGPAFPHGDTAYLKENGQPPQHVFVIVMENSSYSGLLGNPDAPWINQAARTYELATNYYGVAHPSQPNYLALTSGSIQGVRSDETITVDAPNLVDQLETHGHSWKAYMQSLFAHGNTDKLVPQAGDYVRKHDPFVSYADIQHNPARMASIVDFSQFAIDLQANTVPDFAWISPDLCHDTHGRAVQQPRDPCADPNLLIRQGDAFLHATVDEIMHSQAWNGNSLIFLTWDESESNDGSGCCDASRGGGHILTLIISHNQKAPRSSRLLYNHYALLATLEDVWGLGCLANTCDTTHVHPMTDLLP